MTGDVKVNELPASSGQTMLSSSRIVTGSESNSAVELGKFTRLMVSERTELALDFSAIVFGSLRKGEVRAFMPAARALSIITPGGVVAIDSSHAALVRVQADGNPQRMVLPFRVRRPDWTPSQVRVNLLRHLVLAVAVHRRFFCCSGGLS